MDSKFFNLLYWQHYIILEEDFKHTRRYVELNSDNFETYSVEYTKLLQSIGSEFDVICKEICKYYGYNNKQNIIGYADVIIPKFTGIKESKVLIRDNDSIVLEPLKEWNYNKPNSPGWWKVYNKIKHDRSNNFKKANLYNVLMGLTSLFLIEMYFIYEIATKNNEKMKIPNTSSLLFEIKDWKVNQISLPRGILLEY